MLELRPICENCAKSLPPDAEDARICSFECTFCADCVDGVLHDVCPNCGGGFEKRPVRPQHNWRNNNTVGHNPAVTAEKHRPVDPQAQAAMIAAVGATPPHKR